MAQMLFLEDTYRFSCPAVITGVGANDQGSYILLDQTVFYPQGGGQPSDVGHLETSKGAISVSKVRLIDGEVFHFFDLGPLEPKVGDSVTCQVDPTLRLIHAASHTAGHFIANVIQGMFPSISPIKAYHFMDGPYVEFSGDMPAAPDAIAEMNRHLKDGLSAKHPIKTCDSSDKVQETVFGAKTWRTVQIGSYEPTPCGGTHLRSLAELRDVQITKLKKTKEGFRASYSFAVL